MILGIFFACGMPKLHIIHKGEEISELIQDGRYYLSSPSFSIHVHNMGTSNLDITRIETTEQVICDADLPILLSPNQQRALTCTYTPTKEGEYAQEIHFLGNIETKTLLLKGVINPYIQYKPQELSLVDEAFALEFAEQELIGSAVAIVEGADIIYMKGMGFADRENEEEVDPRKHRFRWASLSKGLVAYVSMQQVERGRLDLDVPISEYMTYTQPTLYLPEECQNLGCTQSVPPDTSDITLRLLLSHTGGIQHYNNGISVPVPSVSQAADPEINTGMEWALDLFLDHPLVAIPKTAYHYTTFGYNLAGVAVEYATNRTLNELVDTELSQKSGIKTLSPDYQWAPQPNRVVGYDRYNDQIYISRDTDVSWKLAGGGFQSTVEDLARYCAVLLGNELMLPSSKEELWTVQESTEDYAFGFEIKQDGAEIRHSGAQQSTRTGLIIDRERDLCYVMMSNSTWARPFTLLRRLQGAH